MDASAHHTTEEALEQQAKPSLSPGHIKKLRKKLLKQQQQRQVVHTQPLQPATGQLPPSEGEERQASPSLQLSGHGPGTDAATGRHTEQEEVSQPQAQRHQRQAMQEQHGRRIGGLQQQKQQRSAPTPSTGPCRTDLSGQLFAFKQALNSNSHDTEGNSNSTFSQLMLHRPAAAAAVAPAASEDSHGTQPAGNAATAAAGHTHQGHQRQQQHRQQQQQPKQQQQSRKRSRASCQYGNYHHYYGYRLKPSSFEDPRLKALDPAWFQGADVLDVGCNEGLVTLALAVHCGCRSVTGVDIDPVLVSKACTNLSRSRTQLNQQLHEAIRDRNTQAMRPRQQQLQLEEPAAEEPGKQRKDAGPLGIIVASTMASPAKRRRTSSTPAAAPEAGTQDYGAAAAAAAAAGGSEQAADEQGPPTKQQQRQPPHALGAPVQAHKAGPKARIIAAQRQIKALSRVSFKAGNWLELPCPSNKYEVITCFSVTKWIQLNWGDDGIMKLFNKFYRCLAPGGTLVLEPQPFKSYKNAVHKPGVQAAPFVDLKQLKLRPDQFAEVLTQRVGFELVQSLNAVSEAAGAEAVSVKGFDRPILVLRKPYAARGGGYAAAAAAGAN